MKKIVMMVMAVICVAESAYARSTHNYGNEAAALAAINPSVVERIREVEEWVSKRYPECARSKSVAHSFGWQIVINPGAFTSNIAVVLYWDGSLTVISGGSESSAGTWYPKFIPPVK